MSYDDSSFLSKEDFVPRMRTAHTCPCCRETVDADEDVAVLEVVQGAIENGEFRCVPILDADGDYKYEPIFVHFRGCWTDIYADLEQAAEDIRPVEDREEEIRCNICRSSIRAWEVMAIARYGEFKSSQRSPSNQPPSYLFQQFKDMEDPTTEVCLACILGVVGESLSAWEDVSENGECAYCSAARCWRKQICKCECHE